MPACGSNPRHTKKKSAALLRGTSEKNGASQGHINFSVDVERNFDPDVGSADLLLRINFFTSKDTAMLF